jgi:cephalosporin hydroxylase
MIHLAQNSGLLYKPLAHTRPGCVCFSYLARMPMPPATPFHSGPLGWLRRRIAQWFFADLIRATRNFSTVTWAGQPIWQNILDLWVIQEAIFALRPAVILETGTNRGGSSLFYAQLLDLIGHGRVVTVDVQRLHDLQHPRVTYLIGSSVDEAVLARMRAAAQTADGPVFVILDSDHSAGHVRQELEAYAPLVTPGSYLLVQDGVIDTLRKFRQGRPGPLVALREFLREHPEFEIDPERCRKFPLTHHPDGWLRRRPGEPQRAAA